MSVVRISVREMDRVPAFSVSVSLALAYLAISGVSSERDLCDLCTRVWIYICLSRVAVHVK